MAAVGKQGIRAEFDAKADSYEENRLAAWYQAQALAALEQIPAGATGTLLDIGCGTGWLLREAIERHPRLRGVGIDVSPGMIASARRRAQRDERLEFYVGDWERSQFDLPPIRYAVCVSAMHYFEDPHAAFTKVHAALEPDGSLLLLDRAREGSWMTSVWDFLHRLVIRDDCRFFSTSELLALMSGAGFADAASVRHIKKWFWHGKLHTSLALLNGAKEDSSR